MQRATSANAYVWIWKRHGCDSGTPLTEVALHLLKWHSTHCGEVKHPVAMHSMKWHSAHCGEVRRSGTPLTAMTASPAPIGFNDEGKLLLFGIEAVSFCVCLCRLCVFERGSVLVCVRVCARGHARERGGG